MKTTVKQLFPRNAFVGFDHLINELDFVARNSSDMYPPHNIIKVSDTDYLIEIAVAGFALEQINIESIERTLTVVGDSNSSADERGYIHRGISTKKFKRVFRLSEYVEVIGAELKGGILSIHMEVELPEARRPRNILIKNSEEESNADTNQ